MTPTYLVGSLVFAGTVRMIGVQLGRAYPCPAMHWARVIVGAMFYTAAFLALVAGLMD